jgi:hypothetical protein
MAKPFTHKKTLLVRRLVSAFALFLAAALVFSCNQDSIFAGISAEPEPKKPRIAGTAANIVVADAGTGSGEKAVYAASTGSSTVHKYRNGVWTTFSAPGSLMALASDDAALYALVGGMNSSLRKYDAVAGDWTADVWNAPDFSLQTIYGAGGKIFAGGKKDKIWAVFYIDGSDLTTVPGMGNTGMLTGAAEFGGTYLAVDDRGIYSTDLSADAKQVKGSSDHRVTGIINTVPGGTAGALAAVTRGGTVLVYDSASKKFDAKLTEGPVFTGGMSVWRQWKGSAWKPALLLLGISSTGSNTKAYREVDLDSNGKLLNSSVYVPGTRSPSSVSNKSEYDASIARYSVHYILQVPGEAEAYPSVKPEAYQPVIFAATAKDGFHSLRNGLWNAEE